MKKPKISILISAYNAENYLEECIQSVLKQDYEDYELIIVDDGSTDSTLKICRAYEKLDSKIKVYSWENHGLILARRKGVELSNGEYILFLDADDLFTNDALSTVSSAIVDGPDVVVFRFKFMYGSGMTKESPILGPKVYTKLDRREFFYEFIKHYEYNHMWSKAIKRELLINDSYNYQKLRHIKLGEDLLQSIHVYGSAEQIIVLDDIIYLYRVLANSMSHGFNENHVSDISNVYQILNKYIEEVPWDSKICVQALYDEYTIKISALMRDLWCSGESLTRKMLLAQKILKTNTSMINEKAMVIQNRVLWYLCKYKLWNISNVYTMLLKNLRSKRK